MIDKERVMKESANFCAENCGYIHSEMKNGKMPELVIAGDFLAMMWQTVAIIDRIAYKTNHSFEETAMAIFSMKTTGYDAVADKYKDAKVEYVEGEDWQEEWKKKKEQEIKREANLNNITLALNMAQMEKRNTSLNNQLVDLKKEYTKNLKAKDEQIKKLSKECQALEHRMKEMEAHTILPEEKNERS